VLRAIQDGPDHVSVVPIIPTLMPEWIASRPNAKEDPHFLTEILITITVRVK